MYWWIWMLAGIGVFWTIFSAICIPTFIIGGFIALKQRFEIQEKVKGEERETLPPSEDAEKRDTGK